jgi:Zn-dependent protease with chaperone function
VINNVLDNGFPDHVLPDLPAMVLVVFLAILINLIAALLPRKIASAAEILISAAVIACLFIMFPFVQASILLVFGASAYGSFGQLADRQKREKRRELERKLREADAVELPQDKDNRRIAADLCLALIVCAGAGLFFLLAPDSYAAIKLVTGMMLISVSAQMIERTGDFFSARLYWLPEEERLVVLSLFQPRDYPLQDLKEVLSESRPDLLKLHPLFAFFSDNRDYTSSFGEVLRLSFPGENVFITPRQANDWKSVFAPYGKRAAFTAGVSGSSRHAAGALKRQQTKDVLPLWHPAVLKRLFWKGYFAVTVKGVSAYTGLLLILIWLDVPAWAAALFVILWWALNVYVSDRVLIAATDAAPLAPGELHDRAQALLQKAGIPRTRLFIVDSPVYNGMAMGMNIGRAAIMLTSATLRLPPDTVEAILAHEAVHVKKRDVLLNQLARLIFFAGLSGLVYLFFGELKRLAENAPFLLFVLVYALTFVFPVYLSFVSQWCEVRADHLGAALTSKGRRQMAEGLADLARAQDRDSEKSFVYSLPEERPAPRAPSSLERDKWFWRLLEFQLMLHPPMYWRLQSLGKHADWREARKAWMIDRFKESWPDCFRKKRE